MAKIFTLSWHNNTPGYFDRGQRFEIEVAKISEGTRSAVHDLYALLADHHRSPEIQEREING